MAHAKTESDATSLAPSSPPAAAHGTSRRPAYYVMSPAPSHHSLSTTPGASPVHQYTYNPFGVHHSRESFVGKYYCADAADWRRLRLPDAELDEEDEDGAAGKGKGKAAKLRVYACVALAFVVVFMLFALVLWGASKGYKPIIFVKSVEYESYHIQAGTDSTGVPTKLMSVNATVKISFHNPATFFGDHVTSTPLQLYYSDLLVASGTMKEFYQPRKSGRVVTVSVVGKQVPLYGGGSALHSENDFGGKDVVPPAVVPLRLTFVMRARAHVLGDLVKSKFYRHIGCNLLLREAHLRHQVTALRTACEYQDDR